MNKLIGDKYELYVLKHLQKTYDGAWLFKHTPEKIIAKTKLYNNYALYTKYKNCDIGADLVAIKDDVVYFIQCKNYSSTIGINDLSGFYFLLHEFKLEGIVYYSNEISERLKDMSSIVKYEKLEYIEEPIIIVDEIKTEIEPRQYQLDAYNKLKDSNRAILSLPCGMGKTFTSCLLSDKYDNIIILSPLRELAKQNLKSFYNHYGYNKILLSMDGDNFKIYKKNIISSTYDSCKLLIEFIEQLKNVIIIIDEFHNLSYNNLFTKNDPINILLDSEHKILFMSATPPNPNKYYGENIYNYPWSKAIEEKYICDFNITIPDNTDYLNIFDKLLDDLKLDNKELVSKVYFLLRGMLYESCRKCIVYTVSHEQANLIKKIITWMQHMLNITTNTLLINCNTSKKERKVILNNFKECNDLSILINISILNEGIDIPECDSVYIIQPSDNMINLVQRMCRCVRRYNEKKVGNIFMWCTKDKTEEIMKYLMINSNNEFNNKIYKLNTIENKEYKMIEQENNIIVLLSKQNNIEINNNNKYIKITEYLKLYSSVSHTFIDDMSNIIKDDYIERPTEFLIDSENLRKLLKLNDRQTFNNNIKTRCKENVDYKIQKIKKSDGSGGHNYEVITLTPMATKKICLLTKSKISSIVKQYFIDIELVSNKYKNYIIDEMAKKIDYFESIKY